MPQTTYRGYEIQTTGTNAGTWGTVLNDNMISYVDVNWGGVTTLSLASTTPVALTTAQARNGMLIFSGALLADIAVTTTALGAFWVENRTTGNFIVSLSNGTGNAMLVPQGAGRQVWSDATYGVRALNLPPPGTFVDLGSATPHPSLLATTSLVGEYLVCDGSSFLTTGVTANLYQAIGTTWGAGPLLPDLRGRARFGKDLSAGRITTAGSGIDGATVGSVGGAQTVTIAQANLPSYTLPNSLGVTLAPGIYVTDALPTVASNPNLNNMQRAQNLTQGTATVTGSVTSGGSGTATNKMPPAGITNVLIKI